MAPVQPGMFDWETALQGADWFHWSELIPALGPEAGGKAGCALNCRSAPWTPELTARVMRPLLDDWIFAFVALPTSARF